MDSSNVGFIPDFKKPVLPDLNINVDTDVSQDHLSSEFTFSQETESTVYTSENFSTFSKEKIKEGSTSHPFVGRIFKDNDELKHEVGLLSLVDGFEFKIVRSSNQRYVARCISDGCEWLLRARNISNTKAFHVTYFNNIHSCSNTQTHHSSRNANKKVLGHIIKEQMKEVGRGRVYRGKEIVRDINQRFKANISYKQAWVGKCYVDALLNGSADGSFEILPLYCYNLEKSNPGTVTHIETDELARFEKCFIAIGAVVMIILCIINLIIILEI